MSPFPILLCYLYQRFQRGLPIIPVSASHESDERPNGAFRIFAYPPQRIGRWKLL